MTEKRNLRQRILNAGIWTIGGHTASQALRLVSNLIMTRLLLPEAFGIMVIANSFILGLTLFSDVGLGQSVVRSKRGHEDVFTNTVWTIQVLRGCLIWGISLVVALVLAVLAHWHVFSADSVYAHPQLPLVLCTLALSAIVLGLESTNLAMASRALNVRKITLIELQSQIGALAVMAVWAYLSKSIWALVVGAITSVAIRTILSHTWIPGIQNRFQWDKAAAKEIIGFGKWVFISSILGFFVSNGDKLIMGGLMSASSLGMFSIASFLINAIQQVFSKLSSTVGFPTFCEVVRNRPEDLKKTYYKLRLPIDLASLFGAGFLFSAGHVITQIMYNQRYHDVGHMFEILSLSLLEIRYGLAGDCFMAMGRPKILSVLIGVRLPIILVLLPLAYNAYGTEGAIWVSGCNILMTIPIALYYKQKLGLMDVKKELQTLPSVLVGYGVGMLVSTVYALLISS